VGLSRIPGKNRQGQKRRPAITDYWKLDHDTVLMVLENYQELSTGAKPESPVGYDNPETKRTSVGRHGPFEGSVMLAAEVARRVKRCGLDGMLCEERYGLRVGSLPMDYDQIAVERFMDSFEIFLAVERVTHYITGRVPRWEATEKRKGIEYKDWVGHGRVPKCRIFPTHNIRVWHAQSEARAGA